MKKTKVDIGKSTKTMALKPSLFFISVCFVFFLSLTTAFAQQTVTGKITDTQGQSLPMVNVMVKGTSIGVLGNENGNYTISIPENAGNPVLVFSFIGFADKEETVGPRTVINASLESEVNKLDEAVVVSYGTQKKREVTGAISQIKASDLSDLNVGQIGQKLQGQIAGVQINQTTGQPGQGMGFRIRGAASISAGSEPLFVIDGMPVSSGIGNINPDEIESFSVLKDAAATSLYGSRASNGVILITTKRSKSDKVSVEFNGSVGVQTLSGLKKPDVMNAREFTQYMKEFYEDKATYEGYTGGVPGEYQNPEKYGEGTNWYDLLTRSATIQNYSLTLLAGKGNFNSATVVGYFKQNGILHNTSFERYTARTNMDYNLYDRVKIGVNLAPSYQVGNNQGVDGHRNILGIAIEAAPHISAYDANGNLTESVIAAGMLPKKNWRRVLEERVDINKTLGLLGGGFAEVDIWNGFKYKFQIGVDLKANRLRQFTPSLVAGGWAATPPQKASANYNTGASVDWTAENMLTYTKSINNHNFDLLAGYSAQKYMWEGNSLSGNDFPNDDIEWIDAAATKNGGSSMKEWALVSVIGRANYNYKGRYMLQATIRRDGCSRFGKDNKYANFPSVSAGWITSDEPFMQPIKDVMNYLKIRASYGLTGNYNIGDYLHYAGLDNRNYVLGGSLAPGNALNSIGNNRLTWEESKQFDIGIDMGFLNDRIYFMYDFYNKKTNGMLYAIDIPYASGFGKIDSNIGDFKAWGHEFTVTSRNLINEFKWTTNLNISFLGNEVTRLGTQGEIPIGGYGKDSDFSRLQVGQPVGVFVGYVFDGVYMTQAEYDSQPLHASSAVGSARMKDISGADGNPDGKIDEYDKTIIGDPNPDFVFGITNEFKYKNFDLGIVMSGQVGGDVLNANLEDTENLDGVFNVRKGIANRWRSPENPGNGEVPRTLSGTTELYRFANTHWVEKGTNLTIKNITLGYTIPFKQTSTISKLRVYFSVQQVAVFSKYSGLNPEISLGGMNWKNMGVDRTAYPVPRTFSFGCSITL